MHNFIGIQNKTDNFRKGVYTDPYDEPTYLTFALDFIFDEVEGLQDESMLWKSMLFNENEGAIPFLNGRGYTANGSALKVFKEILRYLTFDAPWYFQEISGLDTFWKKAMDIESGQKTQKTELTIKTLEAVDLRMTELASIYRGSVYDLIHMRERVPDNLRWFSMDIYIAEARNLRYRIPGLGNEIAGTLGVNTGQLSAIVGGGNVLTDVLRQYGYVKFRCRQCEFDFSDSFAAGKTQSVETTTKPAMNQFKIKVGFFQEESRYADGTQLWDDSTRTMVKDPWKARELGVTATNLGSFMTGLPNIGGDISQAGQAVQNSLATIGGLINPALGAASSYLNPSPSNLGKLY